MSWKKRLGLLWHRLFMFLVILGPGLITASADNDAPGIATYSMAGSIYGYRFLWIILWITVGEIVVQEMAARMGVATGKGLTDLVREEYGVKPTLWVMLGLMLANFGTTTAQFAGIAVGAELLGVSRYIAVPVAAIGIWLLVLRGSYRHIEKVLLVLCLYAFSYVASGILVKPDWAAVAGNALVPQIIWERGYLLAVLATVGTTITPWGAAYMQATVADKGIKKEEYRYTRVDVAFGALMGNLVSAFIIIATAATLHAAGIAVDSAEEAARALAPLAGQWAELLFAVGLLGASVLAASVLPLSTTYAVCEAFGWERGVNHSRREAPVFYNLYTAQIVLGVAIVLIPGIPLFPLMWLSQVANAVLLPVVLFIMLKLANNVRLMGDWRNHRAVNVITTGLGLLVSVAAVAMFLGS
jgi:Mn2+/Fe2+ NRAMP family transporter